MNKATDAARCLNSILYWTLLFAVCLALCYIYCVYPLVINDLEFTDTPRTMGLGKFLWWSMSYDNSRLGNILAICLLQGPRWIIKVIQCVAVVATLAAVVKISSVGRSWKRLALCLGLFIITPVWEDGMFGVAYSFNYLLPLPLMLATIYFYAHPDRLSPAWAVVLCIVTAAWHESVALLLLTGWGLMWLFARKSCSRKNLPYIIGVIIGFALLFVCHGIYVRIDSYDIRRTAEYAMRLFFDWPYFAYVGLWLLCLIFRRSRAIALQPLAVFALGGFILIPFVVKTGLERAMLPAVVVCCCAASKIIPQIFRLWQSAFSKSLKFCCAAILYVFTIIHLAAVARETSIVAPMFRELCEVYDTKVETADASPAFVAVRYPWQAPWITLRRPQWNLFLPGGVSMECARKWWRNTDISPVAIPVELKEYQGQTDRRLPSNSDLVLWKGHIISRNPADTAFRTSFTKYRGSARAELAPLTVAPFHGADGREYVYLLPSRSWLSTYFGAPTEIELLP